MENAVLLLICKENADALSRICGSVKVIEDLKLHKKSVSSRYHQNATCDNIVATYLSPLRKSGQLYLAIKPQFYQHKPETLVKSIKDMPVKINTTHQ